MTAPRIISPSRSSTYIQPNNFTEYLFHSQQYCLFLDIDGTLAEFTLNPKDSLIPQTTLMLLQSIQSCGIDIAIVTGRSLIEARQMLAPLQLPIAATHGLEISLSNAINTDINNKFDCILQINTNELVALKQALIRACLPHAELTIENKPYSVALHYRQNPTMADVVYDIMSTTVKAFSNWMLKQGKFVWEIVPKGADKGTAILTLLDNRQHNPLLDAPNKPLCPIFIGDDLTDEAGFLAVQKVNGLSIKVGVEDTCAQYYINGIDEVTALLNNFLTFCQSMSQSSHSVFGISPSSISGHLSANVPIQQSHNRFNDSSAPTLADIQATGGIK